MFSLEKAVCVQQGVSIARLFAKVKVYVLLAAARTCKLAFPGDFD